MILSTIFKKSFYMIICSAWFISGTYAMDQDPPNEQLENTDKISQETVVDEDLGISKLFEEVKTANSEDEMSDEPKPLDLSNIPFPDAIYSELIKYTIGQDDAMKSLATFVHEHLISVKMREEYLKNPKNPLLMDTDLEKPNILMMGPTGCGKTSSIQILSKLLKIPFAVGNATEWTAQGYIGGKWQDVFDKLYSNTENMMEQEIIARNDEEATLTKADILKKASTGIIFIDEFDKICNASALELEVIDRVQQELLPAIQGMDLKLSNNGKLNTTNILFIAGGAFPGLIPSGGTSDKKDKSGKPEKVVITPQKLERYGMLPELAGRLCNIVQFDALNKNALKRIILESKNSFLQQYIKKYKAAYNIDLSFEPEAIDYVAEVASKQRTGARAINSMIFKLMQEKTFNIRGYIGQSLSIDKNTAKKALKDFAKEPKEEKDPVPPFMYL